MKKEYQEIGTILKHRKREAEIDKRFGVHTSGIRRLDNTKDYYDYVPTPYHMLNRLFYKYPFTEKDVFVDVGSGLGRVLIVAAMSGCSKVIGIEINEDIYKGVVENIIACNYRNSIEAICGNAESVVGTKVIGNKYFFFNPFNLEVLKKIIENILSATNDFFLFFMHHLKIPEIIL